MSEVKIIKLSGSMARLFGREHRLAVKSPAEAIRALCATRPGFEKYLMNSKDNGINFTVFSDHKNLEETELQNPSGADTIRFIPVPIGSKKNGVLQIIIGVVLIAVGAIIQFYAGPNLLSNYLYGAGISMIVGGVVAMLTPVPKNQERKDDLRKSYVFNGSVNVQAQGNPVPLLYGELIVGSAVISAGISTVDNYIAGRDDGSVPGGGHRGGGGYNGDVVEIAQ